MTITSRQNPLVARFRTAARGDVGGVMLLEGAHLVGDAIAAAVTFQLAAVTPAASEEAGVRSLVTGVRPRVTGVRPLMTGVRPLRARVLVGPLLP